LDKSAVRRRPAGDWRSLESISPADVSPAGSRTAPGSKAAALSGRHHDSGSDAEVKNMEDFKENLSLVNLVCYFT